MKKYKVYIIASFAILALCISICFVPIDASRFIPIIEEQVTNDLGIKIHIEKLILRFGPSLKIKTPVMHIMYEDGQKFGQFDNVKFYIPWSTLFKNDVVIKRLYANKLIVKVNSDDKFLPQFISKMQEKKFEETPNMILKSYQINYYDNEFDKKYKLSGTTFELVKLNNYQNYKINSIGEFLINDKKYISYDLAILPKIEITKSDKQKITPTEFLKQLEALDFHSDIIADLKLYKNTSGETQVSGLVNIDNISVLDSNKKLPKSFIYLTFLGDKIGILSNISANIDKKVYIEGIINNSKKPSIDLKVKTDEIQLSDLYHKVKLLSDFSKFKEIESISGTMAADFNLKGDLNKIKSSGYLKIANAGIKANGMDINKIDSEIDFSNNAINIVNAIGYVNNAPIMARGKIDKTIDLEFLMSKVEMKHVCPPNYGVKSGIISLVANISGNLQNIIHKENIHIENFSASNNNNSLAFADLKIDTNKNNIAYIDNISIETPKTKLIKLPQVKLHIDRDIIKIPETNIFMPNSKLKAKAEITNFNTNNLSFNFNLDGFINSRDIENLTEYGGMYPIKLVINGNKNVQNITSQIVMEKALILDEPVLLNLVTKIENNTLKLEDFSILSYNGKFSNDFKSNLKGTKKLIVSGIIENLKEPDLKNIRIFIPQQLNINLMDTIAQIRGDVFINGKYNKPEIVGQINVQNVINQFLQLSISNMTIDFNKNIAMINAPQLKIGDSTMGINSTIINDFSNELCIKNLSVKSKYINTDTLLMYKDNPLLKSYPVHIHDGKFYAEKALVTIYTSPLYLSAVSTDFVLKDNNLMLRNLNSELFNGKLAGSVDLNLKDENFISKIQSRGVSAAPIFDIISTRKDSISGNLDFDAEIAGNLSSKQSLNGGLKFIVHNGRMGTLGKLEHLLYAQNVIADNMLRTSLSVVTKAITLKDTGLFKYLRGEIILSNGIANIKMLQSQGPLMTLFIKGQYNPINDYAKLIILGRLSDEVVSGLGAFGEFSFNKLMVMLTGEDSKYNFVPDDFEKLPQLPAKNTKEFRSIINGIIDKPSSVIQFNWISYSQKSYRQKEVPMSDTRIPEFVDSLPY